MSAANALPGRAGLTGDRTPHFIAGYGDNVTYKCLI